MKIYNSEDFQFERNLTVVTREFPIKTYKDGSQWIFKPCWAYEVLVASLYRLLAGANHIPDVCVVVDRAGSAQVAFEYQPNFKSIYYRDDEKIIRGMPIDGVELLVFVAIMLGEVDFVGSPPGNFGFNITGVEDQLGSKAAFIDFNGAYLSCSEGITFGESDSVGEISESLISKFLLEKRLLNREAAIRAIRHLSTIDDQAIVKMFDDYKDILNNVLSDKNPRPFEGHCDLIIRSKNALCARLEEFEQESHVDIENIPVSPEEYQAIENIYRAYDQYYAYLHKNAVTTLTKKLIRSIYFEGRASKIYSKFRKIIVSLRDICMDKGSTSFLLASHIRAASKQVSNLIQRSQPKGVVVKRNRRIKFANMGLDPVISEIIYDPYGYFLFNLVHDFPIQARLYPPSNYCRLFPSPRNKRLDRCVDILKPISREKVWWHDHHAQYTVDANNTDLYEALDQLQEEMESNEPSHQPDFFSEVKAFIKENAPLLLRASGSYPHHNK